MHDSYVNGELPVQQQRQLHQFNEIESYRQSMDSSASWSPSCCYCRFAGCDDADFDRTTHLCTYMYIYPPQKEERQRCVAAKMHMVS